MGVLDGVQLPQGKGRFWRFFVPIGLNGVFFNENIFDMCVKS